MAVYTPVSDAEISRLMARYDLGAVLRIRPIAEGVSNTNYRVDLEAGPHVLTLFEPAATDPAVLPFLVSFVDHLQDSDIPCPPQRRDGEGRALQQLAGRDALLVAFLPGDWPREPNDAQLAEMGRWLAGLHLAGQAYAGEVPDNRMSMACWQQITGRCGQRADEVAAGLTQELAAELATLQEGWPAVSALPHGAIHADLFPDNTLFQGDQLSAIIDFCYACKDALAYDLAIVLNAWCCDAQGQFEPDKAATLLAAYQSERPLATDERKALPLLMRAAAMRFVVTRLRDWLFRPADAVVTPKDPMQMIRLLRQHRDDAPMRAVLGDGAT